MKQIYKVTLFGGYVGLVEANSLADANNQARSDQGRSNVERVTLASEEDIAWVRAMGGSVPKLPAKLPSEWARDGYYVVEGWTPQVGHSFDYYDRDGQKRSGLVKEYDGKTIKIDSERTVIVKETFNVRFGR